MKYPTCNKDNVHHNNFFLYFRHMFARKGERQVAYCNSVFSFTSAYYEVIQMVKKLQQRNFTYMPAGQDVHAVCLSFENVPGRHSTL